MLEILAQSATIPAEVIHDELMGDSKEISTTVDLGKLRGQNFLVPVTPTSTPAGDEAGKCTIITTDNQGNTQRSVRDCNLPWWDNPEGWEKFLKEKGLKENDQAGKCTVITTNGQGETVRSDRDCDLPWVG